MPLRRHKFHLLLGFLGSHGFLAKRRRSRSNVPRRLSIAIQCLGIQGIRGIRDPTGNTVLESTISIRLTQSTTSANFEVYRQQGKYAEAISCYERALKIFEREFGVDHVNSASTLHNIGLLYKSMADWVSAKSYFERASSLHRQCRGPEHEFTIGSERELTFAINVLNDGCNPKRRKLSH